LELNNTITEQKTSMGKFNSRLDHEETIRKFESRSLEIIQLEGQKEK
jgi:hypothetical protein